MSFPSSDAVPQPQPALQAQPTLPEILLAVAAHLSSFIAPFLAPLIIWLITRTWLPYVGRHARAALVTHLLTLLAIGIFGTLAVIVFVLFLGGTISVPPAGGWLEVLYFVVFVLFALAALLAWVFGMLSSVLSAIQAVRGKPAHPFWSRRRRTKTQPPEASAT